jgi:hypothetical protein
LAGSACVVCFEVPCKTFQLTSATLLERAHKGTTWQGKGSEMTGEKKLPSSHPS